MLLITMTPCWRMLVETPCLFQLWSLQALSWADDFVINVSRNSWQPWFLTHSACQLLTHIQDWSETWRDCVQVSVFLLFHSCWSWGFCIKQGLSTSMIPPSSWVLVVLFCGGLLHCLVTLFYDFILIIFLLYRDLLHFQIATADWSIQLVKRICWLAPGLKMLQYLVCLYLSQGKQTE